MTPGLKLLVVEREAPARTSRVATIVADDRVASFHLHGDAGSALEACSSQAFDVALVDLAPSDGADVQLVASLARVHPPVPCVVLVAADDCESVHAAISAGARACLLSSESPERIVDALVAARNGAALSTLISPSLLASSPRANPPDAHVPLTPRERELLVLLARGCTYEECSRVLGVKFGTVQGYVKSLYRRLDVCTKAEATARAVQLGWLDPE